MAKESTGSEISETLAAPLGSVIAAVGRGVAEAQEALDRQAMATFKEVQGGGVAYQELRAAGFQPTWYRIPEAEVELTVALSLSGQGTPGPASGDGAEAGEGPGPAPGVKLYAAPVDAGFVNKYEFNLQAASKLRFKVVPVPPPAAVAEMMVVPDGLLGESLGEVRDKLEGRGVPFEVVPPKGAQEAGDGDRIVKAVPASGQLLAAGQKLSLVLTR